MTRIIVTGTTLFYMFFLTGCTTVMSHGPRRLNGQRTGSDRSQGKRAGAAGKTAPVPLTDLE